MKGPIFNIQQSGQDMDENTKKKIIIIRDLIKKQQYQQALEEAEIVIYKNSKIYQAHLMAGLCYDKLNKPRDAEKSYLEALELKPDQPNAIKALCELYGRTGNTEKSAHFLQAMLAVLKTTDRPKYMQNLVKLVEMFHRGLEMEKIDGIFQELLQTEAQIGEELAQIAEFYFKTALTNQCFYLDNFLPLGLHGQSYRVVLPSARQRLNLLFTEIARYLYSVRLQYNMTHKDIAGSIYQMRVSFPQASCFLMLFLLDDYCVSQSAYNGTILQQIYALLTAFYDRAQTCYLDVETLEPEMFVVSVVLAYEYLAFMKQFFILDECFNPYYERLEKDVAELEARKVREQYRDRMAKFILKECRLLNKISATQNVERRLEELKYRILKLEGSYLQQVVAKMAMNCYVNYQRLNDMKNMLKIRIKNMIAQHHQNQSQAEQGQQQGQQQQGKKQQQGQQVQVQPHLYKYYYDYLIKIAKLFKSLDEEINIYDAIEYVHRNDQKDLKYLSEYYWLAISRRSKQQLRQAAEANMGQFKQIESKAITSVKSQAIRRYTVLMAVAGQYEGLLDGFKLALGTDRCFENLLCIGFYYFIADDYDRALRYLKQAFVIRQDEYHLNRSIFIALLKTHNEKEAYSFLERIYQGFPNVYWVNYALAMHCINSRRIESAYKYLNAALQAFMSAAVKSFRFSYEKTIEMEQYSLVYMIDQNQVHILQDYLIVPENHIYSVFPMASSLFFTSQLHLKQIRLETQLGEVLKLLGRNKSAYNHLAVAHCLVQGLGEQARLANLVQVVAAEKQYATMLFYVRAYKEAEQSLNGALRYCQHARPDHQLIVAYQSQIHALLFEVSVMRLDQLMKFQSYEAVDEYIGKFTTSLAQFDTLITRPSLNYYKSKYQFYILCYLHDRKLGIDRSITTIEQYLRFFRLDVAKVDSDGFYNRLLQMKNQQRIIVKQCLEDYYVLRYMRQNQEPDSNLNRINVESVMPLLQLFPTSTVFYIVYGMAVQETRLKISAFLKCIQLDRESPISIDLLASLFLKQKDYLTATKLFLKSLEIDLFNTKSYIGLCTCLYVLIGQCITRRDPRDQELINKALNKINSYMQFLRLVDPSEDYHILKFLRTIISNQPLQLFEIKAGFEQARKLTTHKHSDKLLHRLLQQSSQYLKQSNIWTDQGKLEIFAQYLHQNQISTQGTTPADTYHLSKELLHKTEQQYAGYGAVDRGSEVRLKIKCKMLNRLCIVANLWGKAGRLDGQELSQYVQLCGRLQQGGATHDPELQKLQLCAKNDLILALIKSRPTDPAPTIAKISQLNHCLLFAALPSYSHIQPLLQAHPGCLPLLRKYILRCVLRHPADPTLRHHLLACLLTVDRLNNLNVKKLRQVVDYRLETLVQMNTDAEAKNVHRQQMKMLMLGNVREPNAWLGYVEGCVRAGRRGDWVGNLLRLLRAGQKQGLTEGSRKKAIWLLVELTLKGEGGASTGIKQVDQLVPGLGKVIRYARGQSDKVDPLHEPVVLASMKYIIPMLVSKYKPSVRLLILIDRCTLKSEPMYRGFFQILKFLSISSQSIRDQSQLMQQHESLVHIIRECSSPRLSVHPNTLAYMQCLSCMLTLDYPQLDLQLSQSASGRFVTQSDQILINYFEIMRLFREVQVNPQGENVYESFSEFVESMIAMCREPMWRGYFLVLQAMAQGLVAGQEAGTLTREWRYGLMHGVGAGAGLLRGA